MLYKIMLSVFELVIEFYLCSDKWLPTYVDAKFDLGDTVSTIWSNLLTFTQLVCDISMFVSNCTSYD